MKKIVFTFKTQRQNIAQTKTQKGKAALVPATYKTHLEKNEVGSNR